MATPHGTPHGTPSTPVDPKATWARWNWSKGFGRGHRLFDDGNLTQTACATPRKSATHTAVKTYAQRPTDAPLCPICKSLDDLVEKSKAGNLTDAISKAEITAGIFEPGKPVEVPVGACLCGAAKCDQGGVRDIRLAVEAQKRADAAAERAANEAAFEAFLASKGAVTA